ncbi:SMI1/KNR4 family protein [Actinomadura oligospora]|uniref:SMI1/KNR4 family protein n=1 Tax=Actinomadura oligospora TaxID=111804 RepID=UPI0004B9D462|nr:SMI1/KNR4 family protein [Actinomadura oligospora]
MAKRRDDPGLPVVLREMCARIAGAAPTGWVRATASGVVDRRGVGVTGVVCELADGGEQVVEADLRPGLRQVYRASGESERMLRVRLAVAASGEFEAVIGGGASEVSVPRRGFLYVVGPEDAPGDPGDEQDGPDEAVQAGDPDEAVRLLREYCRFRGELFGLVDEGEDPLSALPAPVPAERLAEVERGLGVALPADLRALYGVVGGDGEAGIFERLSWWLGVEGLAGSHGGERHWAGRGGWKERLFDPFVHEADPPGTVRRSADRPGWVPFVLCTGGDFLAVDMDPASRGRPGQVIRVSPGVGVRHVADSVTSLLRRYVDALTRGDFVIDGQGELRIDVPEPRQGPSGAVQILRVDGGGEVDLEQARREPHLRAVELTRCASADLAALRAAPLETLDIEAKTVDLAPLAGHPTLRRVTVAASHPVDLEPLRSLTRLECLDVSRVPDPDLRLVAGLDGLRYLALTFAQWERLWESAGRMPGLEAAFLAGKGPHDKVAAWIARLEERAGREGDRPGGGGEVHRGHL